MQSSEVRIPIDRQLLDGTLAIPDDATGIVVFAHGGGSSRHSPRNRQVASQLHESGLATLLFDLLSEAENWHDRRTAEYRLDIPLLARRLVQALGWLAARRDTRALPVGLFGTSTGAAAALMAAARVPHVRAVVSQGGRPDLAGDALQRVAAPTLLIVGGLDEEVAGLNQQAARQLRCEHRLVFVPGATHLFEEPGALDVVARLAADWFASHLSTVRC